MNDDENALRTPRPQTTIDALRLVEEFARASITDLRDGSWQEPGKDVADFAFASELPDSERGALFCALYSVSTALSIAKRAGRDSAALETEMLVEYYELKAEAEDRARRSNVVAVVCLLVVAASIWLRAPEIATTALIIFAASYAPHIADKIKGLFSASDR